jgi:hypothetical protein
LTEEAVYKRLARGRKMLKTEVEKQIKTILETTRPDTAFTMAVLASLPLVAATTTTGCSIAGTGTASQAGWLGWWWLPLLWLFMPIILITGGFMGLWTALKHSPTVRTRRFMCRTALQWFVFIWVFQLIKIYIDDGYGGWDTHGGAFFACYFAIIIGFCAWLVYRWRLLLEEDAGLRPPSNKPLERTSLSLFWLRCWYWLPLLPVMFYCVGLAEDCYREVSRDLSSHVVPDLLNVIIPLAFSLTFLSVPIGFYLVVGYGIRTSRDENSLHKWYPRDGKAFLPKAEERTHWTAFWFDLTVMCCIAVVPMIPLIIFKRMMFDGLSGWILISSMLMTVTTLIASHSAGIPGKRLRGYAKLCLFLGLCYMILSRFYVFLFVAYFAVALLAFVLTRWKRKSGRA